MSQHAVASMVIDNHNNLDYGEVEVTLFIGNDGVTVVQIDTVGTVRVNLNDGELATFAGDRVHLPEHHEEFVRPTESAQCFHCGADVTNDGKGSWLDATDGDGCDNPAGVHQVHG